MASRPKAAYQSFQTSWAKTLSWAQSQNIPTTSIAPVYQLDAQRMATGNYPMSEAERVRAILASSDPKLVTPLPTDRPEGGLSGFFHNAVHDVENIFTGLNPIHLGPALWDMTKNTFEHPGELFDPRADTLAQLIPGVSVIGQIEQHGIGSLATDPVSSLLDVLPMFDGINTLVSKAGRVGDMAAKAAGYDTAAQMAKAGAVRTAIHTIGQLPTSTLARGIVTHDPSAVDGIGYVRQTLNSRINGFKASRLLGKSQADFHEAMQTEAATQTQRKIAITKDFMAVAKVTPVKAQLEAVGFLQKTATEIPGQATSQWAEAMNSATLTTDAKRFIDAWTPMAAFIQEEGLAAGDLLKIEMPDGKPEIWANTAIGQSVLRARTDLAAAQTDLETRTRDLDQLHSEIQRNDLMNLPGWIQLDQYATRVMNAMNTDASTAIQQFLGTPIRTVEKGTPALANLLSGKFVGRTPLPYEVPSLTAVTMIQDVFKDGGLLKQAGVAFTQHDFRLFRDTLRETDRKLNTATLRKYHSPLLDQTRTLVKQLLHYAQGRAKAENAFQRKMDASETGYQKAAQRLTDAAQAFQDAVRAHPPTRYQPIFAKVYIQNLLQHEEGIRVLHQGLTHYQKEGVLSHESLEQFRKNPQQFMELATVMAKASSKAPFLTSMADQSFVQAVLDSTFSEVAHLRSIGLEPRWVPKISSTKLPEAYSPRVHIPMYKPVPDFAHDRMMETGDSVYDIVAATDREITQILARDGISNLLDNDIIDKQTYTRQQLVDLINREPMLARGLTKAFDVASREAVINDIIDRQFNLVTFDPHSFGNIRSTKIRDGETLYIDKDFLRGMEDSINKGQLPQRGVIATGTKVFRTAILGFSPRYTAHITLGGTFLQMAREPLSILFLPHAIKLLRDPEHFAKISATSTQMGAENVEYTASRLFHMAGGRQMFEMVRQEYLSKGVKAINVIPQMNLKFTNYVTNLQRAMVYSKAVWAANLKGKLNIKILDPETGEKVDVTQERAQEEAMQAVDKVMGNLSHMSPLERNVFIKLMPFWGWTKHILTYVASYPLDHPYKAIVLSHLANINSADVPTGLPLRIQNLFYLGTPDAYGNVKAIDVRALNPLRDVANYASLSGWLSGLNPAITSVLGYVDPQMVYGDNVLYPNLTYDRLYGITVAPPQGSLLTGLEQFVPQIGALDAAFALSANFRDMKANNPAAFSKAIYQALNIPFAQEQSINLRQMAAKNEMDRYQVAKAAAAAYAASPHPDPRALVGYTDLPDPQNPIYALSPAELEAIVAGAERQTGLPASVSLPQLPNPLNL